MTSPSEAKSPPSEDKSGLPSWTAPAIGLVVIGAVAGNVLWAQRLQSTLARQSASSAATRSAHDTVRKARSFERVEHLLARREARDRAAMAKARLNDASMQRLANRLNISNDVDAVRALYSRHSPASAERGQWEFVDAAQAPAAVAAMSGGGFGGVQGFGPREMESGSEADGKGAATSMFERHLVTAEVIKALGTLGFDSTHEVTEAEARLAFRVQALALHPVDVSPEQEAANHDKLRKISDAIQFLETTFYRPDAPGGSGGGGGWTVAAAGDGSAAAKDTSR